MNAELRRFRLRPSMRLQRNGDFQRLKAEGRRSVRRYFIANWRVLTAVEAQSRLGVVTSRRLGSAVHRNRARRLLREAFRLCQHVLSQPIELVLVARPLIGECAQGDVQCDFLTFLRDVKLSAPAP